MNRWWWGGAAGRAAETGPSGGVRAQRHRNSGRRIGWRAAVVAAALLCAGPAAWSQAAGAKPAAKATASAAVRSGVAERPKLVVVLVVDQMRTDYFDRYGQNWTRGLKRLREQGAWFRLAEYPYVNTVTCAGHATIGTGSFPATHGAALNAWYDRRESRLVSCTDDPNARTLLYNGETKTPGHSAWRLMVPTLAQELRVQQGTPGRSLAFSGKARSAIMLAGHRADAVTWFEEANGSWATSSAFATEPLAFLKKYVEAHPVSADYGKEWNRMLPPSAYQFEDAAAAEKPPRGWTNTFPHRLASASGRADAQFFGAWAASPLADEYLAALAQASVEALGLGRGPQTDFLGVSFSALDLVGHNFGPRSHEVQDVLARLDVTLGKLFDFLDHAVGRANYVVAFSSDHGVAPIPEQMSALGLSAGRVVIQDVVQRVNDTLGKAWGEGRYVARMVYPDLYFAPGIFDRLKADAAAMRAVTEAIAEVPGVWRVFRGDELSHEKNSHDPVARSAALGYFPGRSGDLVVIPRPYWFFVSASQENPPGSAATHGTSHLYDARVPVILMGAGIKAGEYLTPATPADIAPTLAHLCGVTLARPDGRVLSEALVKSAAGR